MQNLEDYGFCGSLFGYLYFDNRDIKPKTTDIITTVNKKNLSVQMSCFLRK